MTNLTRSDILCWCDSLHYWNIAYRELPMWETPPQNPQQLPDREKHQKAARVLGSSVGDELTIIIWCNWCREDDDAEWWVTFGSLAEFFRSDSINRLSLSITSGSFNDMLDAEHPAALSWKKVVNIPLLLVNNLQHRGEGWSIHAKCRQKPDFIALELEWHTRFLFFWG